MLIHQNPSIKVAELVTSLGLIDSAAAAKLPSGIVMPSQLRYALVGSDVDEAAKQHPDIVGEIIALGDNNSPENTEIGSCDLLVVPEAACGLSDEAEVLEKFISLANKAEATVIVATAGVVATHILQAKGFSLVASIGSNKSIAIFSRGAKSLGSLSSGATNGTTNGNGAVTNGTPPKEVIILGTSSPSSTTLAFSGAIKNVLEAHGYATSMVTWGDNSLDFGAKTCISLLEWEQPLLDRLSKSEFEKLRELVLQSERLLWVTGGDDPRLGMVDGFARTIRSEMIEAKFQVLHLSGQDLDAQHGASLVSRILTSDHADDEFRETEGLLQVARTFRSPGGNDALREHLENSTRVTPLGQLKRPVKLTIGRPGLLDTLHFVQNDAMVGEIADTEVEIQVKASGVK